MKLGYDKKNNLFPCLISLNDNEQIKNIFEQHKPEIIFHAAAYKHVHIMTILYPRIKK